MDVSGDSDYAATLTSLSEASVRHFNPYTDVDWEAPDLLGHRERPTLGALHDRPAGRSSLVPGSTAGQADRHRDVAPSQHGQGRYAIRGHPGPRPDALRLLGAERLARVPLLRARVDRGMQPQPDVPGDRQPDRRRRSGDAALAAGAVAVVPFYAGPLPDTFFFGVLAGEVPFDYLQTNLLREPEPRSIHPIMQDLIAIHVAEEARHISFAHEYLHRRVPRLTWFSRFALSLYVPVVMRMLGQAMVVPSRASSASSASRARYAKTCISAPRTPARPCGTCSATSACSATNWV